MLRFFPNWSLKPGPLVWRTSDLSPWERATRADDRGWTEVVEGGLEIHDIPGGHETIFERPHVELGAEKLAACIQAALRR
jgi:thioesterase domain-containing protein